MKILAYTSPSKGHLYPLMPTLLELRRRGHQVAVRTLASEVELLKQLWLCHCYPLVRWWRPVRWTTGAAVTSSRNCNGP